MKNTPARRAIVNIFRENSLPLDAESVYKKISKIKGLKNTNEATIYRNLSAMEKSGILKKVDLRKNSVHFELTDSHHHHIVCTNCERIEDFENSELEKVLGRIKSSKFNNIKEHSLELFGLCRMCT